MKRPSISSCPVWCALTVWAAIATGQVLNEVLYDPQGADTGGEFVELFNGGSQPVSVAGYRLEFANGANEPHWVVRWTGAPADSIPAGGFFLICDEGWSGESTADAVTRLALQNGPDAIRLVGPDGNVDLLGYGQLEYAQMYEGQPAAGVSSGHSLGRRPDGRDTDVNALDWTSLDVPTPGTTNFQIWQLTVAAGFEPPALAVVGATVQVVVVVANTGLEPLPATLGTLWAAAEPFVAEVGPLAVGELDTVTITWRPVAEGRVPVRLVVPVSGSSGPLELALGSFRIGLDALYINEVMAAPVSGACEWIEVMAAGREPVQLDDYLLRDADGQWRRLPARLLEPDRPVVLVQDESVFLAWWSGRIAAGARPTCPVELSSLVQEPAGSWPTLNNSAPDSRSYADRVLIADPETTIIDYLQLGSDGRSLPAGRSVERINRTPSGASAANWAVCTAAVGSTPGCVNSVAAAGLIGADLALSPNPFFAADTPDRSSSPLHVRFRVPAACLGWEVRVFDLWGHLVRDLGGDLLGPGPRDLIWDGRDDSGRPVPRGGYIVLLRLVGQGASYLGGGKKLVVLAAPAP